MILVEGEKYACIQCIRGHRSSSCHHTDRPLVQIRSRGRPTNIETDRVVIFAKDAKHVFVDDKQKPMGKQKTVNPADNKYTKRTKLKNETPDFTESLLSMKLSLSCCGSEKTSDSSCSSDSVVESVTKESDCCSTRGSYNQDFTNFDSPDPTAYSNTSGSKKSSCCASKNVSEPLRGCCSKEGNDQSCPTKSTSNGKVIVVRPSKRNLVEIKKGSMKIIEPDGFSKRHKSVSYTLNPVFRSKCTGYNNERSDAGEAKVSKINKHGSCCGNVKCNCTSIIGTNDDFKKYCHVFKINPLKNSESQIFSEAKQKQSTAIDEVYNHDFLDEAQMQEYLSKLSKDSLLYLNNCMCDDNCACELCLVHNSDAIERAKNENTYTTAQESQVNEDLRKCFNFGISEFLKNFEECTKSGSPESAISNNTNNLINNQVNNVCTSLDGMMSYTTNTSLFKLEGNSYNANDVVFLFADSNTHGNYSTRTSINNNNIFDKQSQKDNIPGNLNSKNDNILKSNETSTSFLGNNRALNFQYDNGSDAELQIRNSIDSTLNCFDNGNTNNEALEMYDFIVADSCTIPGSCACKDDCFCEGCVEHNNNRNKS